MNFEQLFKGSIFVPLLFGSAVLLVIGAVVAYWYFASRHSAEPAAPEFRQVLKYARKYLARNAGAKPREIRKACLYRFAPEPDDQPGPSGSGAVFGLGGLAGAAAGRWVNRGRHEAIRRRVEILIDDVLDRLDEERERGGTRNSPDGE